MESTQQSKISWYQDDDFEMQVEDYNNMLFLHLPRVKWSKKVVTKLKEILHEIEQEMKVLGYPYVFMGPSNCSKFLDTLITKHAGYSKMVEVNNTWIYGKEL